MQLGQSLESCSVAHIKCSWWIMWVYWLQLCLFFVTQTLVQSLAISKEQAALIMVVGR